MSEDGLRRANKRGGKKVQKKRKLWEQVEAGQHTPQTKTEVRPIHLEGEASSGARSSSAVSVSKISTSVVAVSKTTESGVYINDPVSSFPPPLPQQVAVGGSSSGCRPLLSHPLPPPPGPSPAVATPVSLPSPLVESSSGDQLAPEAVKAKLEGTPKTVEAQVLGKALPGQSRVEPPPNSKVKVSVEKSSSLVVAKGNNSGLPVPIPKVVSAVIGGSKQEAWLSVDFNGVCNIPESGDRESEGIHQYNIPILLNFINTVCSERGFRLGITSYIGVGGQLSQTRKHELTNSVREFNRAVNPSLRLGLRIVAHKTDKASFLDEAQAALHIDDRLDLCDHINQVNSRIKTVLVTKPSKRRYHCTHWVFNSLRDSLEAVSNGTIRVNCQLHSRAFEEFWAVPS